MLERGNQHVSGTRIIPSQRFSLGWLKRAACLGVIRAHWVQGMGGEALIRNLG